MTYIKGKTEVMPSVQNPHVRVQVTLHETAYNNLFKEVTYYSADNYPLLLTPGLIFTYKLLIITISEAICREIRRHSAGQSLYGIEMKLSTPRTYQRLNPVLILLCI